MPKIVRRGRSDVNESKDVIYTNILLRPKAPEASVQIPIRAPESRHVPLVMQQMRSLMYRSLNWSLSEALPTLG